MLITVMGKIVIMKSLSFQQILLYLYFIVYYEWGSEWQKIELRYGLVFGEGSLQYHIG